MSWQPQQLRPPLAQSSIAEPSETVRSLGRRKYSTGLAALRDIATKRRLRQPARPGAAVGVIDIWERK